MLNWCRKTCLKQLSRVFPLFSHIPPESSHSGGHHGRFQPRSARAFRPDSALASRILSRDASTRARFWFTCSEKLLTFSVKESEIWASDGEVHGDHHSYSYPVLHRAWKILKEVIHGDSRLYPMVNLLKKDGLEARISMEVGMVFQTSLKRKNLQTGCPLQ